MSVIVEMTNITVHIERQSENLNYNENIHNCAVKISNQRTLSAMMIVTAEAYRWPHICHRTLKTEHKFHKQCVDDKLLTPWSIKSVDLIHKKISLF